jgi:hypothetical protein
MAKAWRMKPSPTRVCCHSFPPNFIGLIILPAIEVGESWNTWNLPEGVPSGSRFKGALQNTTPTRNSGSSLYLLPASGAFLGNVGSGRPVENALLPKVQTRPANDVAPFPSPTELAHIGESGEGEPMSVDNRPPASNDAVSSPLPMVWDTLSDAVGPESGFQDALMFDDALTCM